MAEADACDIEIADSTGSQEQQEISENGIDRLTPTTLPGLIVVKIINEDTKKAEAIRTETPYVNDGYLETEEDSSQRPQTGPVHGNDLASEYEIIDFRSSAASGQHRSRHSRKNDSAGNTNKALRKKSKLQRMSMLQSLKRMSLVVKQYLNMIFLALSMTAFVVYFVIAMRYKFGDEGSIILLVLTVMATAYQGWRLLKKMCSIKCQQITLLNPGQRRKLFKLLDMSFCVVCILLIVIYLLRDILIDEPRNFIPGTGILLIVLAAYVFSKHTHSVKWRPVLRGVMLQISLAILIHRWHYGYAIFYWLEILFANLLAQTEEGTRFVFGYTGSYSFVLKLLPTIIFVYALVSVFFHIGFMQYIMRTISKWISMFIGISPTETLTVFTNIFFDQTESLLTIQPYVDHLTKSELHTVFVGGFATMSIGTISFASYLQIPVRDMLAASVISAPAAIAVSKLFYPENKFSTTSTNELYKMHKGRTTNILDAISKGATRSVKVITYIVANIIAFMTFLHIADTFLTWLGRRVGFLEFAGSELTFKYLCSLIFWPIAFFMGIDGDDRSKVAGLIGVKTFLNENLAFVELSRYIQNSNIFNRHINNTVDGNMAVAWEQKGDDIFLSSINTTLVGGIISDKSLAIVTHALGGAGSFVYVGMVLGVIAAIAPSRKRDASKVIFRAMIAGFMTNCMTACVIGMLYKS